MSNVYGEHASDSDSNSDFDDMSATHRAATSKGGYEDGDDMNDVPVPAQRPLPKRKNAQISDDEDEDRRQTKPVSKQQRQGAEEEERRQLKPSSAKSRQQTLHMPSAKEGAPKSRAVDLPAASATEEAQFLYWCQQSGKIFEVPNKSITVAGQGCVTLAGGPEQLGALMTKGAEAVWKSVRFDESKVYVVTVRSPQDKEYVVRWMVRLVVADADGDLAKGSRKFLVAVPNAPAHAAWERWSDTRTAESALAAHLPKKERHRLSPTQLKWNVVRGQLTDMCHVVLPPKKERCKADDPEDADAPAADEQECGAPPCASFDEEPEIRFGVATAAGKQKLFASAKKAAPAASEDTAVSSEAPTEVAARPSDNGAASHDDEHGKRELCFTFSDSTPKKRVPQAVNNMLSDMPAWVGSVTWTLTMKS